MSGPCTPRNLIEPLHIYGQFVGADGTMLAELTRTRNTEVDALIVAQGCDGKDVQMLMRLYASRPRLKRHAPDGPG